MIEPFGGYLFLSIGNDLFQLIKNERTTFAGVVTEGQNPDIVARYLRSHDSQSDEPSVPHKREPSRAALPAALARPSRITDAPA